MAGTATDRFKVMLEEHTDGGVTQRQYTLRDVMKMVNEEPGTVGKFIVTKEVYANKERVEVAKLPKGAILQSVCIQEEKCLPEGCTISFGVGDDASSFGTIEKPKEPILTKEQTPHQATPPGQPQPGAPTPGQPQPGAVKPVDTKAAEAKAAEAKAKAKEGDTRKHEKPHLHKSFGDGKESEKEETVFAKISGLKDDQKPEGLYKVVMVYEKFNEFK
jgi:hypothetical protein